MSRHKLDLIDRKILQIIQFDGEITNAQLSKDIGLSPAPTLERVKKLKKSGVIKGFHAQLDPVGERGAEGRELRSSRPAL